MITIIDVAIGIVLGFFIVVGLVSATAYLVVNHLRRHRKDDDAKRKK